MSGLANLTATNLRSIVGEMELDMTLSGRDIINSKMQMALDTATDPWGIKVTRVEVKNIQPPREIEEVMTKQMRAERERRETVLQAEAHQESIVKRAEGDKRAKVLAAEAERDAQIAIAQGKAESVKLVYKAEAEGLEMLKSANVNDTVLKLRGLEALKTVADGRATKIFLPTDISATVSSLGALTEAVGIGDYTKIDKTPKEEVQRPVDPCLNEHSTSVTLEAAGKSNQIADDIEHRQY
jgi:regulator of protease activity HflC (stomatin/prohibitin superfamily)